MRDLAVDYPALIARLGPNAEIHDVGSALLDTVGSRYEDAVGRCELLLFEQSGVHFVFDLASSGGLPQADRTVAAYALTPVSVAARDASYQRGFPMEPASDTEPVDRGHLIPRLSEVETGWVHGGAFEFERFDNRPFAR